MDAETRKIANAYCYNSYHDTILTQLYLAEQHIPFSYTDTISVSEVKFILNVVHEYIEEKNRQMKAK